MQCSEEILEFSGFFGLRYMILLSECFIADEWPNRDEMKLNYYVGLHNDNPAIFPFF